MWLLPVRNPENASLQKYACQAANTRDLQYYTQRDTEAQNFNSDLQYSQKTLFRPNILKCKITQIVKLKVIVYI